MGPTLCLGEVMVNWQSCHHASEFSRQLGFSLPGIISSISQMKKLRHRASCAMVILVGRIQISTWVWMVPRTNLCFSFFFLIVQYSKYITKHLSLHMYFVYNQTLPSMSSLFPKRWHLDEGMRHPTCDFILTSGECSRGCVAALFCV